MYYHADNCMYLKFKSTAPRPASKVYWPNLNCDCGVHDQYPDWRTASSPYGLCNALLVNQVNERTSVREREIERGRGEEWDREWQNRGYEWAKRERKKEGAAKPVRATSWTCECRLIGAWSVRVLTHESRDRWQRRGRGVEAPTGGGGGGGSGVRVCFSPPWLAPP